MISSNLIGGTTGYLLERQRRLLFVHERELEEEREYHLKRSLHDPLTGLPNRELLYDRLRQAISQGARNNECHAGFFIDLDGFKPVNDRMGHKAGDRILIEVGERLSASVRKSDTVARLGGDEFFVLAIGLEDKNDACGLAEKLLAAMREPFPGVPAELALRASVGICLFPFPGVMPSSVIHRADMAMYEAKENLKDGYCLAPEG
ncbi:GGDEF domain-containing protein [Marinobacter nauticus]